MNIFLKKIELRVRTVTIKRKEYIVKFQRRTGFQVPMRV